MKKRALTWLLLLSMLITLLPMAAFAEELPDEIQAENAEFAEEFPEELAQDAAEEEAAEAAEEEDPDFSDAVEVEYSCESGIELDGVKDTDYPVMTNFSIQEKGQTLAPGDTIQISLRATDDNGIKSVSASLNRKGGTTTGTYGTWVTSISLSDMSSVIGVDNLWVGTYTVPETAPSGEYYIYSVSIADTYGLNSYYYRSNGRRSSNLPDYFFVNNPNGSEEETEAITDIALKQAGQTVSVGSTVEISFSSSMTPYSYGSVSFAGKTSGYFSLENTSVSFDEQTKKGTITGTIPEDATNGERYIRNLYLGNVGSVYYSSDEYTENLKLTVTGGSDDTEAPQILSFDCKENNQTLTDGDTVHFTMKLSDESEISNVWLCFNLYEKSRVNQGVGYSSANKWVSFTYNSETKLWEGSYTFAEDDVYGVYEIESVSASDVHSNNLYYYQTTGIEFLFAENRSETFKRLSGATDLVWGAEGPGTISFTLPDDHQGQWEINIYRGSDSVSGTTYYNASQAKGTVNADGLKWWFIDPDELVTGDYTFTVQIRGDGETYYASEMATSPVYHYIAPTESLPAPVVGTWQEVGDDYKQGTWTMSDTSNVDYYWVKYYFADNTTDTPVSIGSSYADQSGAVSFGDWRVESYGTGYYYYTVIAVSKNIEEYASSPESAMSDAYAVTDVAGETTKKLDNIDTSGKTAAEIRSEVQAIGTSDLHVALASSDDAVDALSDIEAATGLKTNVTVSADVTDFSASKVSVVGATLNDLNTESDVTLQIGRAKNDDVVPAAYDNTLAVRFAMDLDNVQDTENLKVPVAITLPIPSSINPSFAVVLHYPANGGEPEAVYPTTYEQNGQWYMRFVLTSFSDFIVTQTKDGEYTDDGTDTSTLNCQWGVIGGKNYWYENGVRQGTYDDANGVVGDGTIRGREIYDSASDGWYWLDACYDGAKAVSKEVWMPYIYQNEASWDEDEIWSNANASDSGMAQQVHDAITDHVGKWVRYNADGKMYKGWCTITDSDEFSYCKDQVGNTYYYDNKTGLMAKGWLTIDGKTCHFDETTGVLIG